MGLDISHDCWNGAYSGFNTFREALHDAIGITWAHLPYRDMTPKQIDGYWDGVLPTFPDGHHDPLLYLLIHQDCEGVLELEYLEPLRNRLIELVPAIEATGDDYVINHLHQFIKGLGKAIKRGEDVEFH